MAESSSVGPLWYNVLLKGVKYKCFYEIAAITAIASARTSIFVWPTKFRPAAHLVLSTFFHPCSDHMTGLNAYFKYKYMLEEGVVDPRHWCENHFLSLAALGEVNSLYRNILEMFDLANMDSVEFLDPSYDKNIRWALAEGLCYQVAYDGAKNPKGRTTDLYRTINDNQPALLSATSVLANNQDVHWVVFSEYVHTGKQYLQGVTAINPEWLIVRLPYHVPHALMLTLCRIFLISRMIHWPRRRLASTSNLVSMLRSRRCELESGQTLRVRRAYGREEGSKEWNPIIICGREWTVWSRS